MKFAHEFREALEREGFPARWVASAVPYGKLKKCLKKVQSELNEIGLDPETFARLVPSPDPDIDGEARRGSGVTFQYDFSGKDNVLIPRLTLFVELENGVAVDAALSPETKRFLQRLVFQHRSRANTLDGTQNTQEEKSPGIQATVQEIELDVEKPVPRPNVRRVEVPLSFDAEFFDILQADVTTLDALQVEEQKAMGEEIVALSAEVTKLAQPSKFHKTDMYRWRELFDLYLQAGVFFSTHELDRGKRDSTAAARQLQWFQSEVTKRGLKELFKLPASHQALDRFIRINITLLRNLKFQEINQKAISKILKKFDKRTQLGAGKTFPKLIQSDPLMSETMAKAVCSQLSQDLVEVVPKLDDYSCPVCLGLRWHPIRLKCGHPICSGCTVTMQLERKPRCPLCRENVIMEAGFDNIDEELEKFLKKNFPREVREKRIENEIIDGVSRFGPSYVHPSQSKDKCQVM